MVSFQLDLTKNQTRVVTASSHSDNAANKFAVKAKHWRVRRRILPGQTNKYARTVVGHRALGGHKGIHAVAVRGIAGVRCIGVVWVNVVDDFKSRTRQASCGRNVSRQRLPQGGSPSVFFGRTATHIQENTEGCLKRAMDSAGILPLSHTISSAISSRRTCRNEGASAQAPSQAPPQKICLLHSDFSAVR